MKKAALWAIFLLFCAAVQASFLSVVFGANARPDLLLTVVVSAGILGGKELGLGIGFFAGLLQDLASGNIFGLNTLSKMAVGHLVGLLENKVFKENFFLPAIAAVAATVCSELFIFGFLYLLGYKIDLVFFFTNQFPARAFLNLVMATPIHKIVVRLVNVEVK